MHGTDQSRALGETMRNDLNYRLPFLVMAGEYFWKYLLTHLTVSTWARPAALHQPIPYVCHY